MQRTRVKICGITRPEDALAAVENGVDAIGLVFYKPSPRSIDIAAAQTIVAVLPPFVTAVGLFVDAEPNEIQTILSKVHIDLLQFHGHETPNECVAYGKPYIKAIRMRDGVDLYETAQVYQQARALLLDTYQPGVAGGTGTTFDWARIPTTLPKPVILAGGLTPENVAQAITQVRPYAVDVSGGVEAAKGIKDQAKIMAFMRGVNRVADQS